MGRRRPHPIELRLRLALLGVPGMGLASALPALRLAVAVPSLNRTRVLVPALAIKIDELSLVNFYGGEHGTRTHEAVTPYSLSRRAP